jgi:putative cell wall-binding protein
MRKARKSLAILLAVAMVFCMAPAMVFGAGDDGQVNRIAGNDRYITSAETALRAFESADTVLIARGDDEGGFADGLAASYLAGVENAPILLTEPNGLPPVVKDAISKLGAKKAIILGGPAVVSDKVKDDLAGLEVERIFGDDRFETAAKIAAKGKADTAFVVSGYAPADSLVAGPLAFSKNYPILLVGNNVPDFTSKALADLGIKNIYVIGGTGVVSESVYNDLAAKADQIVRYGGNDRVATSLEVAQNLYTNPVNFSIVGYDGLADAVGAAVFGNPILYTDSDLGISGIQSYLAGAVTADSNVNIFGGTGVVSNAAETALENIVPDELKVEIVSAINANTILVTFEGIEEPVEIELEEALVHGQTEVTFVYNEVEYTAELTEAYVDPEVDAAEKLAAATEAVEVAEESELQEDLDVAMTLVEALPEGEDKDALVARLAVVQEAIDERVAAEEALAAATEAVVLAEESLLEADLAAAQGLVDALEASDDKVLLNARINSVQLTINGIVTAVNNANTEVKLYNALNVKPFVNVNIDNITAYNNALTAKPYETIAEIQEIIDTVNTTVENADLGTVVSVANTAVGNAEADPTGLDSVTNEPLIDAAQDAINAIPDEITEEQAEAIGEEVTVKADLQERLDGVRAVEKVLTARNQIELNTALKSNFFERVNEDLIGLYASGSTTAAGIEFANPPTTTVNTIYIDASNNTGTLVSDVQAAIDAVNLKAAQDAVTVAETNLTATDVATAQALVTALPDLDPNTVKEGLQDKIDVVNAVLALDAAKTEAEVLAALKAEVLNLTSINDAVAAEYKTIVDSLVLGTTLTITTDLQATVITVGNDNALGDAVSEIETNFVGYDATASADQAAALAELQRLADVSDDVDADTIIDELIEEYIVAIKADLALSDGTGTITGADADKAKAIQALITAENAGLEKAQRLAAVNEATTAAEMRTALTAVAIAETDGYVDLTSQEKLEVAELVLVVRANETDEKFANTTAVTTAISTATSARTAFLGKVNAATTISGMVTALDVAEFPEFQDLGDLEQVEVAELVLNALNELKADDPTAEFETISEIKAAAGL